MAFAHSILPLVVSLGYKSICKHSYSGEICKWDLDSTAFQWIVRALHLHKQMLLKILPCKQKFLHLHTNRLTRALGVMPTIQVRVSRQCRSQVRNWIRIKTGLSKFWITVLGVQVQWLPAVTPSGQSWQDYHHSAFSWDRFVESPGWRFLRKTEGKAWLLRFITPALAADSLLFNEINNVSSLPLSSPLKGKDIH